MRIILLAIGSVMAFVMLIMISKGKKYYSMVEVLPDNDYPMKDFYGVGFAWSQMKMLTLKGKTREKLIGQAKLLYDPRYAEYYANVAWAQMLSFVHLGITLGFLFAGLVNSVLFLLFGLVIAGVFGFYFLNHMSELLKDRETACTEELPEIVSTMALLINSGMTLREGWRTIAESKEGIVYELMRKACVDMENGYSDVDAIHKFGRLSNSAEIRKFTSALAQGLERGGGDLSNFLSRQAAEMWGLKKQLMLQKGEKAASKLLAPTALIFVGIILVVLGGAVGMIM